MQNEYFSKLREKLSVSYIKKYDVTINIVRGKILIGNGDSFEYREENLSNNLNIVRHRHYHDENFNMPLRNFNEMSEIIIIEYNIFDNELCTNYKYDIHYAYLRDGRHHFHPQIDTYINGILVKETLLFNRIKYNDGDDESDDDDHKSYDDLDDNNDLVVFLKNNELNKKKSGIYINKKIIHDDLLDYIIKKELIHNNFKYIIDHKEIKHEKTDLVKKIFSLLNK